MRYIEKKPHKERNQKDGQIQSIRAPKTQIFPRKKEKRGLLLITTGVILVLSALVLVFFNLWDSSRAGEVSDATLRILEKEIAEMQDQERTTPPATDTSENTPADADATGPEPAARLRINGYDCVGILDIPDPGIRLPVLAEWDDRRLKTAPCLYSGSWQEDNMVICGHNYRRHFAPIKTLPKGADVFFETVDGQVLHYVVRRRETVKPTEVAAMVENTAAAGEDDSAKDWDLTLFTCSTGGRTRCAVRCVRTDDPLYSSHMHEETKR